MQLPQSEQVASAGYRTLIDAGSRATDRIVMPRLFLFLTHGIAADGTGYRIGARHPIMTYVTGQTFEEAQEAATRFITKTGWSYLEVKRGQEIASDIGLISDGTLRSAAAAAVDRGVAIVVYQTEIRSTAEDIRLGSRADIQAGRAKTYAMDGKQTSVVVNSADELTSSPVSMVQLRLALEGSWQPDTAHLRVHQAGNPALGQCYPTSRVVQLFFPSFEIACGRVRTGSSLEVHFWNIDPTKTPARYVDLTWQQFPNGAEIESFATLDRDKLNDSPPTVERCELLLRRVLHRLGMTDAYPGRFTAAR